MDELEDPEYITRKLDVSFKLDLDKLIVSGHSFGGGTCYAVAAEDKRFKACLPLDPWLLPISDKLETIKIDIPVLSLKSESYNTWAHGLGYEDVETHEAQFYSTLAK